MLQIKLVTQWQFILISTTHAQKTCTWNASFLCQIFRHTLINANSCSNLGRIELRSIQRKKFVQEKNCTWKHDRHASFFCKWTFFVQISWVCVGYNVRGITSDVTGNSEGEGRQNMGTIVVYGTSPFQYGGSLYQVNLKIAV